MGTYYCDLHIHSCLSPCSDDDMTPANIAGMASINGLTLVALTDHNSTKNCPAFFKQAKRFGIVPVAGMELTTSEDIHAVCLFKTLEGAMEFDRFLETKRVKIPNDASVFGNQLIIGDNDEPCGEEANILWNASELSLEEAFYEVKKYGGICYPAHIDRTSNGAVAVLGGFPEEPKFSSYELNSADKLEEYEKRFPVLRSLQAVASSDAHHLWDISEGGFAIELDDEPYSSQKVRDSLITLLGG